jgi:hypothetical protein
MNATTKKMTMATTATRSEHGTPTRRVLLEERGW